MRALIELGGKVTQQLEFSLGAPFSVRFPFSEALTFFWEHYWANTVKASTTKRCFKRMGDFFRNRYLDEITMSDVEGFRRYLASMGLKGNTINTHHMILTRMFNKFEEWKDGRVFEGVDFSRVPLPTKNPASLVPKISEKQFERGVAWPKKTIYKVINMASMMGDQFLADILEMLYLTKLRPGDLWRITEKNVDLPHRVLRGIQHKTITSRLPSGIPYLIAITNKMAVIISRRSLLVPPGLPLFMDYTMTIDGWKKAVLIRFKRVCRAAKCPHIQMRDFRPSAATLLMDNNVDPQTVQDSLGHTSLRMLPAYTPRSIVHQRKAQNILEDPDTEILM